MLQKIKKLLFWLIITYIAYMFGPLIGFPKILQYDNMVASMARRGMDPTATFILGGLEVLGAIALFIPRLRALSLLLLFPLAVGAVSSHLATGDPLWKFYRSGSMVILIPLALWLDPYFKIVLHSKK
jgi:uncharacterized membrane protein